MNQVRKKWIVNIFIDVSGINPDMISSVMENIKNALSNEVFEDFFETKVLTLYIPTRGGGSRIEVHEIVLDAVGYDKYETVVNNNNLNVQDVLDQLKELLDV